MKPNASGHGVGALPCARKGNRILQHLGAISASIAGLIVGLALGWTSAALGVQTNQEQGFEVDLEEWSWVTSAFALGAIPGSVVVGAVLDKLGRRWVILLIAPITFLAWALHLWATALWMIVVGRLLLGLACGATCVSVPIYVGEMSEPGIRGALATYFESALNIGILIIYCMGGRVSVYNMNVVCLVISVFHGMCFYAFPDTPRWLVSRGRREDARKSLIFYRGQGYDVDAELREIEHFIKVTSQDEVKGCAAFGTRAAKTGLFIATVIMIFQQITGVNAVTFYASQLFADAGAFDANLASVIVAVSELAASLVSTLFVDRSGRRVLLLASGGAMGICTGILGIYFYIQREVAVDLSAVSWLPIVVVSVYMFMFCIGFGPVVWVLIGEIFPDNIKGPASSVASAICWFFAFLVTKFYSAISESLGLHTTYGFFFVMCALACLFIYKLLPETKGKTLDEIQLQLSGKKLAKSKADGKPNGEARSPPQKSVV